MIRCLVSVLLLALSWLDASAEVVSKSYSYFSVRGTTLEQLDNELQRHGPRVKTTGQRHPGATQMQVRTRLGYADSGGRCHLSQAVVTVEAHVILPRWLPSAPADQDTRIAWTALLSAIERHEDQHVEIARDYARQIERRLLKLGRHRDCNAATAKAKRTVDWLLAKHDRAQEKFDEREARSREMRVLRHMRQRAKKQ